MCPFKTKHTVLHHQRLPFPSSPTVEAKASVEMIPPFGLSGVPPTSLNGHEKVVHHAVWRHSYASIHILPCGRKIKVLTPGSCPSVQCLPNTRPSGSTTAVSCGVLFWTVMKTQEINRAQGKTNVQSNNELRNDLHFC